MKSTLLRTSIGILASGMIVAAVLAGPGPQYWNRGASKPTPTPVAPKADETSAGKCDGCKTTPIWVVSDRGPAGKGIPGTRVTGYSHSCTRCSGKIATEGGKTKTGMTHGVDCTKLACCK